MTAAPFLALDAPLQVKLLLYSLLVGASLGAFFDLLRISRVFIKTSPDNGFLKKASDTVMFAVSLIEDILFFVVSAAVLILFCFRNNYGQWRAYMLVMLVAGFFAYLNTVGRLTSLIAGGIARLLHAVVGIILKLLIMPLFMLIFKAVRGIYKFTLGRVVSLASGAVAGWIKRIGELRAMRAQLRREGIENEPTENVNTGKNSTLRCIPVPCNYSRGRTDRVQQKAGRAGEAACKNGGRSGEHRRASEQTEHSVRRGIYS